MNLSSKCKEMRLSLLAKDLNVLQLTVNDTYLEKVSVHKVLVITLCDNLKWGQTTKEIVDKASLPSKGFETGRSPTGSPYHHILRPCAISFRVRLPYLE